MRGYPLILLLAALSSNAAPVDKLDHWSFKPVIRPALPETKNRVWARNEVDRFILARLEKEHLQPAREADRATWLRRVSFDLIGLPPSPEQTEAFVRDHHRDAYEHVVEELLASPRYGERWAQHWLDVVRYADTHGFEVNTERPNAWPYRDYVIEAFNRDTPYDRFIREQIAGDASAQDAATGFLVTASVLLPGQIGADEVSKRLARQDSLDEIVVNTGQTFLGLSIGCARCHDHKFDAISARDYYSMQAFFAGVEYGDRELRTPEAEVRRKEAASLKVRLANIEKGLAQFEPLAQVGSPPSRHSDARLNEETFPPRDAKFIRFTIHDSNQHPTLGLIEPCVDEFEIFSDEARPRNVALASNLTKVTASGSRTSDHHRLEHINDGKYGNSHSWMSDEPGRGWVIFELAEVTRIGSIRWSRDREGQFSDRLATEYLIEVAEAGGEWHAVADSTDRHPHKDGDTKSTAVAFSTVGLSADEAIRAKTLLAEKKDLESKLAVLGAGQMAFAGTFRKPDDIHLLNRGDPEQPKEAVGPAVLKALGTLILGSETGEQQRRLALAQWIASSDNPLTARVMVNRIWQDHFGTGLVETPSDFGRNGARPSHPELLDWLAAEFIRSGWSVKHLHRLVTLSATYRQSSVIRGHFPEARIQSSQRGAERLKTDAPRTDFAKAGESDSDVRLLWRFPSRRLDSESIRDSMLAVSGRLSLKMGGRGFDLFNSRGGLSGFNPVESYSGDGLRRMIYAHKVRREREAVFGAFDCPDAGQSTARRRESTTPIQALNLFNSRFTLEEAKAFADRVIADSGQDIRQQIQRAYQLALSRAPSSVELADGTPVVRAQGLATLCRALYNSNEFLFIP